MFELLEWNFLNETSRISSAFVFFSFRKRAKQKEYPGNSIEVGNDVSTKTRPSQIIGKYRKYIFLDLALLSRMMEILRDITIRIDVHKIIGLIHYFHFCKPSDQD